jgi:hypothetical protein
MQAGPVGDGVHFIHDALHRPKTGARQPVAQKPRPNQDDWSDEEHGTQQVGGPEGRLFRGGGHQQASNTGPRVVDRCYQISNGADRIAKGQHAGVPRKREGVEWRGEPLHSGGVERARDVGKAQNPTGAVGHDEIGASGFEVGADARVQSRAQVGTRDDAAQHPV